MRSAMFATVKMPGCAEETLTLVRYQAYALTSPSAPICRGPVVLASQPVVSYPGAGRTHLSFG